jgi:hypothetical protein
MQYEKHPNQALNCNIFRIPFHLLSNRSHKAHRGHNGFEIRSFALVVSVWEAPARVYKRHAAFDNERAD